jgi:RNA recognition motif-containing protein
MLCCGADSERKMSGRDENQLFIGRLPRGSRTSELEDVFYKYGKMTRCDVKQGIKMAYGFIEYEDKRDAESH